MRTTRLLLFAVIVLSALGSLAMAEVPPMINYQGKLMQSNGTPVPDGEYKMAFAIYGQPTGGTALWSEVNEHMQVKGGLYSVLLGSVSPLVASIFDTIDCFFGVKVGDDPEMTPRQQIASVAYAVKAASAQIAATVPDGAITTSKIRDTAVTSPKLADGTVIAAKIADFAVTNAKLADGAVSWTKIQDGAVTSAKLQPAESWRTPVFTDNWQNFGSVYAPVGFYKDALGVVHLRGLARRTQTNASIMFYLPAGYRPAYCSIYMSGAYPSCPRRIDIRPDGQVWVDGPNSDWLSLEGITFRAEK